MRKINLFTLSEVKGMSPLPLGRGLGRGVKKTAFTLAEVLITLGVIGVVAAMTMPTLIQNHRKHEVETKLKKFYSVMSQALKLSEAENGEISNWMPYRNTDEEQFEDFEEWYKKYLDKHIVAVKKGSSEYGLTPESTHLFYRVSFADGSGFNAYTSPYKNAATSVYIFYCIDEKKCNPGEIDGKRSFLFALCNNGKFVTSDYCGNVTEQKIISDCSKEGIRERFGCSRLIQQNGWKIPNNYPWKL